MTIVFFVPPGATIKSGRCHTKTTFIQSRNKILDRPSYRNHRVLPIKTSSFNWNKNDKEENYGNFKIFNVKSDSKENEEKQINEEESELLNEQLSAYFNTSDTIFQPKLLPIWRLGLRNFVVELDELLLTLRRFVGLEPPLKYTPPDVLNLRLSNEAVVNREREREFSGNGINSSKFVKSVYDITCQFLDVAFDNRPIQRFWFLETVARMPYFAYSSCLHLYATIGWYRSPVLKNLHHAEELNEAYHLAIMESLGGDKFWLDRFLAYHASILYYWCLVILFFISPFESYRFSELLEMHAVDTYSVFLEQNEKVLKELPAPEVAYEYYANFMYYFYEFQMTMDEEDRKALRDRPQIDSLYDVFDNIVRDEREHTKTMHACTAFIEKGESMYFNGKQVKATSRSGSDLISPSMRRKFWKKWTKLSEKKGKDKSDKIV